MIKRSVYIVLFFLIAFLFGCDEFNLVSHEYKNHFVKYYGLDGDQYAIDMVVDNSTNAILILGKSEVDNQKRIFLVMTDFEGNVLWKQQSGGPNDEMPKDIEPTLDGNYIVLSEYDAGVNKKDIKLIKFSPQGVKMDSMVYGTRENDFPFSVTVLSDGGFLVSGSTEYKEYPKGDPTPPNSLDAMHMRFTSGLDPYTGPWEPFFHQSEEDVAVKTVELSPNKYYVFGHTKRSDTDVDKDFNFWFYPLDNNGVPGNNSFKGERSTDEKLTASTAVPSVFPLGGFMLAGKSENKSGTVLSSSNMYLSQLKYQSDKFPILTVDTSIGFINSFSLTGFVLAPVSICPSFQNKEGYLVLSDEIEITAGGKRNIWLSKVDFRSEKVIWSSRFGSLGSTNDDSAGSVAELPDGRIVVVGTVYLQNQYKITLMKMNGNGQFLN